MKINAKLLLVPQRFDLIAKYLYVYSFVNNDYSMNWHKKVYIKHIEAFSGGNFREPGQPLKNSREKYIETFNELIDSIQKNGFDKNISVVPISFDGIILDGGHRVATAAVLNKQIECEKVERKCNFDAFFFKKQMLPQCILEYMVVQYVEIKNNNLSIMLVDIKNVKLFEEMLMEKSRTAVVYKCKVKINSILQDNINFLMHSNYALDQNIKDSNFIAQIYLIDSQELQDLQKLYNLCCFFSTDVNCIKLCTKSLMDFNSYNFLSIIKKEKLKYIINNQSHRKRDINYKKFYAHIYLGDTIYLLSDLFDLCKYEVISFFLCKRMIFRQLENIILFLKRKIRNMRTKLRDFFQDRNINFFAKLWHWINGKGYI